MTTPVVHETPWYDPRGFVKAILAGLVAAYVLYQQATSDIIETVEVDESIITGNEVIGMIITFLIAALTVWAVPNRS